MQMPLTDMNDIPPPPPWWQGPLVTLGFILALFAAIAFLSSCAEYPVAIVVSGEHGSVGYSRRGLEIHIDK